MGSTPERQLLSAARTAIETGQYGEALRLSDEILQQNSHCFEGYVVRGTVLSYIDDWGNRERIIADFTKAVHLNPQSAEAYHGRANAYRVIDAMEAALDDLSMAIALKPDFASAYLDRGFDYLLVNDHRAAVLDLSEAIRLEPDNSEAYFHRGTAYASLHEYERALPDFRRASALDPSMADALAASGMIQLCEDGLAQAGRPRSGCYIAAACYGSDEHPDVMVLRRFRDEVLLQSAGGRILSMAYYAVSPSIARRLDKQDLLAGLIRRCCLEPLVSHLSCSDEASIPRIRWTRFTR